MRACPSPNRSGVYGDGVATEGQVGGNKGRRLEMFAARNTGKSGFLIRRLGPSTPVRKRRGEPCLESGEISCGRLRLSWPPQ